MSASIWELPKKNDDSLFSDFFWRSGMVAALLSKGTTGCSSEGKKSMGGQKYNRFKRMIYGMGSKGTMREPKVSWPTGSLVRFAWC